MARGQAAAAPDSAVSGTGADAIQPDEAVALADEAPDTPPSAEAGQDGTTDVVDDVDAEAADAPPSAADTPRPTAARAKRPKPTPEAGRRGARPGPDSVARTLLARLVGSLRGTGTAVLVVLLVAALGAAGFFGWHLNDKRTPADGRTAALVAARQAIKDFFGVSAATIDADVRRVLDASTGNFKKEFAEGQTVYKQRVVANKVTATGEVIEAGVVSSDTDSAVVLIVADQNIRNLKVPRGQILHYRVQVEMALADGRWRVAELSFVG